VPADRPLHSAACRSAYKPEILLRQRDTAKRFGGEPRLDLREGVVVAVTFKDADRKPPARIGELRLVSYDKALFRHLAKEALALRHFRAGRYAEAARLYRAAAIHAPNREECELKARLAELRVDAKTADRPDR
jgi:hypothetical protein